MRRDVYRHILIPALLLLAASVAEAQVFPPGEAAALQATRNSLEELLAVYEGTAASTGQSDQLRVRARYEAGLIRARLQEGDFQVGDRIVLTVEGEAALSETFTVVAGPAVDLPMVGLLPLRGVLRAELRDHLQKELSRYLRDPVVRAQALIRVFVTGDVARPGFLVVPTTSLFTDVLMEAGPSREAKLDRIRIERAGERIWDGTPMQQAMIEGRTLDQLSLRAGDRIVVPGASRWDWLEIARFSMFLIPTAITLIQVLR